MLATTVADTSTLDAALVWWQDLDFGAKLAIGFIAVVIFLSVYAMRHWAKRKKKLLELMPQLGFHAIKEPEVDQLVPELLMYPNRFEPEAKGQVYELFRRVRLAWHGVLDGYGMVVMDVVNSRQRSGSGKKRSATVDFDRTVMRCEPPDGRRPPDLLVEEQVLFKSQIRGQRSVDGLETFGKHYYLFSNASEEELASWISPALREALDRYRGWHLATHHGVLFLSRSSSREEPRQIESFLAEGQTLASAFLER